jgi:O-succinylbenzoic acid--CoA ligase
MFSLITRERTWTPYEVGCEVAGAVEALHRLGVRSGQRVGVAWTTSPELLFLIVALYHLGAVACLPSLRIPDLTPLWEQVQCHHILPQQRFTPAAEPLQVQLQPSDHPATIIWTSGSMGRPKAALLTAANHYWSALGSAANLPLQPNDRWLINLPLYHVGGLSIIWRCLLAGAAIVLEGEATHLSLVPTQLIRYLRQGVAPTGNAVLLGGGPIPAPLIREARAAGWPIHTTYGLTEMASQVVTSPYGLLPHRELRIADDGEIWVRGKTLFAGYWGGESYDWFPTGDLGRWTGTLEVLGRRDNRFTSGGEKIQPEEIELALLACPGVERAVVVPRADPEFGHRPVAFVDGTPDIERLSHLPRYKHPVSYLPWPEEMRDLKPSRMKLQEILKRLDGRDR